MVRCKAREILRNEAGHCLVKRNPLSAIFRLKYQALDEIGIFRYFSLFVTMSSY